MNTKTLAALTLACAALAGCQTGEAAEETPILHTAEVSRGDLSIEAEATGTVEPVRSVEVKSKASGEILRLYVDVGDQVERGALLAEIDPRDVSNRFDQMEADLAVARARVEISRAQLERSQELLEAQVITEQEHEARRLDFANAEAQFVRAQTNFELAELQLGDVTIRAPMKGTIISKSVEEGQVIQSASGNVSGGTTLFVMANLDEMQVRTLVDETDMGQLRAGMSTTVVVEAFPDRTFRGSVGKIEPQAEVQQNVTMFPVIVQLDNRAGLLKPGMNAEVTILVDQALDVVLVPNGAIVQLSDVGPAAMALGLDVESLDLGQFMRAGRVGMGGMGGMAGRTGNGDGTGGGDPPGDGSAADGEAGQQAGGSAAVPGDSRARFDSLRARVDRGEISRDSLGAIMRAMREGGGSGGRPSGASSADAAAPEWQTRPAVVFVMNEAGVPEPVLIQIGLNDWDFTQAASGVEEGALLAVVGAAQLQAQQQEFLTMMRSRMGGSPFSGRGMGGGRGGGPR
jgi:HlyD family secretion protein